MPLDLTRLKIGDRVKHYLDPDTHIGTVVRLIPLYLRYDTGFMLTSASYDHMVINPENYSLVE